MLPSKWACAGVGGRPVGSGPFQYRRHDRRHPGSPRPGVRLRRARASGFATRAYKPRSPGLQGAMAQANTAPLPGLAVIQALDAGVMAGFDALIRRRLPSAVVLVNQVAEHIVSAGGKRLRP